MTRSVLQISEDALHAVGITPPLTLIDSTVDAATQCVSLLRITASDLLRHEWQEQIKEASFTTVATSQQIADIKTQWSDLQHIFDNSVFNRTKNRRMYGSYVPSSWQAAEAYTTVSPEYHYRIRGNSFYILGTPVAGEDIYFEYMSNNWLTDSTGATEKNAVTADADIPILNDDLYVLGLRWRFMRANGIEYSEAFREYEQRLQQLLGTNSPRQKLSLTPTPVDALPIGYIPDGGWNI